VTAATVERREPGSVHGRIVAGAEVERAAIAVLRAHVPAYLREVERQYGREPGKLQPPRGYILASQFEKWPEDQLPVVVVISPGLAGPPQRFGDGRVLARWGLAAGVIVSASSIERTRENALLHVAAVRAVIAQWESLDGFTQGVEWTDESYDELPFSDTRTLFAAQALFTVTVGDVVTYGGGPGGRYPYLPPGGQRPTDPPEWPRAKSADVELRPLPVKAHELTLAEKE
jgi:hypothetical protein